MNAAVIENPKSVIVKKVPLPVPGKNQVLLNIEGCGICGSNIPAWEGREWFNYPFDPGSPGHEGWGYVDVVGEDVTEFKKGDRVTALAYNSFAEFDIADASNIIKLPDELSEMPFPGEPLGCAVNIFKRSDIRKDDFTAIIGIGFLGSLLIILCKSAGAKVIAISRRDYALKIAEENGADYTIKFDEHWKITEKVKEITNENFCERVIEAAGKQASIDLAGELVQERGKLIVAGYHQDGKREINMQQWNWKGIDVINAHERDPKIYIEGIKNAVEAVINKQLDPSKLYTHTFSLNDINKGFESASKRPDGFMKALVKCY